MGDGPTLDRPARMQFGRVHFWAFSTSRFAPPALISHWILLLKFNFAVFYIVITMGKPSFAKLNAHAED